MDPKHILELLLFLGAMVVLAKPMGTYLYNVLDPNGKTGLEFALKPLERLTYRICRIDPTEQQDWKKYTVSIFSFTLLGFIITFAILSLQRFFPLNPENLKPSDPIITLNTTISFISNTDWVNFPPELTMSYFSNIFALTTQNYCSAGVGICVAAALARGIASHSQKILGNFWVDIVRVCYYIFLPLCLIFAVLFVSEGVPQNFNPYAKVKTIEGEVQTIVQGPIASYEAIKLIGSNGGCPTSADSANPYENPTPLSNILQIFAMLLIPVGQVYYFGKVINNSKHAWSIFIFMLVLFTAGVIGITTFEGEGNPFLSDRYIDLTEGNMEGKEQRFCVFDTAFFANTTTALSNGAMNAMFSSFLPWSQAILLQNMQVGHLIFGGVGSGIYHIVNLIMISAFIAGLVIGRSPDYLGKKIGAREIKLCVVPVIVFILGISGLTALCFLTTWGKESIGQPGPHGFTAMIYSFSSTMSNNGSDYGGIKIDSTFFNVLTGISMLAGRYVVILATMALAGSMAVKKKHPEGPGTFQASGLTFILLIASIFVIINALGYLPSILLGPVYEQILLIERILY